MPPTPKQCLTLVGMLTHAWETQAAVFLNDFVELSKDYLTGGRWDGVGGCPEHPISHSSSLLHSGSDLHGGLETLSESPAPSLLSLT